jgi:hypothetical protein
MSDVRFGIASITIDRPEVYNAFREQTMVELIAAFDRADSDPRRASRPPGLRTRRASENALGLSVKNLAPNWHTTASNAPSEKGSDVASACCH